MNIGPFCGHICTQCFWFRAFGYGLSIRLAKYSPRLFSERAGKRKVYGRCIGLAVEFLRPTPFD
jgi:hypothetical protein